MAPIPANAPSEEAISELIGLHNQGRFTELLAQGRALLRDHPKALRLQNLIGSALAGLGEYEESITALKEILKQDDTFANAHHNLGLTYMHAGYYELAVKSLKVAVSLEPQKAGFQNSLAAALLSNGDIEKATESQGIAIELDPSNAALLTVLGGYLLAQGKLDETIETLEKALSLDPKNGDAMILLAETYTKQGKLQEALAKLNAAADICPNDPDLYMATARFWRQFEVPAKEIEALEQVIKLTPDKTVGYSALAEALAKHGDSELALKMYKKCLEIEPDNAEANHLLAAIKGETPSSPPSTYVENLFDKYAATFERSLTEDLGYSMPMRMAELLASYTAKGEVFEAALDLGCGTGLLGQAISGMVGRVSGVDLSRNMVARARDKGIYDQLIVGDIVDAIKREPLQYSVYLAADVVIYIGALEELFSALRQNAKPGALFLFSTEQQGSGGFSLLQSGRYAHSQAYVTELCKKHGMEIVSLQTLDLRKESGQMLVGDLFAIRIGDRE